MEIRNEAWYCDKDAMKLAIFRYGHKINLKISQNVLSDLKNELKVSLKDLNSVSHGAVNVIHFKLHF